MSLTSTPRILVVDDELDLRELFSYVLESAGYEVLVADNGIRAFEILLTSRIDLILSDLRMPGGHGMDFLAKIRERNPDNPPVIFMTGSTNFTEQECLDRGAQRILMKPFDRKTLLDAVNECLARSRERERERELNPKPD